MRFEQKHAAARLFESLPDDIRIVSCVQSFLSGGQPRSVFPPPEFRIQVGPDLGGDSFQAFSRALSAELPFLSQRPQREDAQKGAGQQDEDDEDGDEPLAWSMEKARPSRTAKRRFRHSVTRRLEYKLSRGDSALNGLRFGQESVKTRNEFCLNGVRYGFKTMMSKSRVLKLMNLLMGSFIKRIAACEAVSIRRTE
jgi:hypothetical protein